MNSKPRKRNQTALYLAGILVGSWAAGCATGRSSAPEPTFRELKQSELASERREFISDTQKRLATITNDMDLLRAKLEHESPYVGKQQSAEWSQELFDLGQERDRLRGELDRAQTASAAEWEQMRGPIGVAADSLQARISKIGIALAGSSNSRKHAQNPFPLRTESGLCPFKVDGMEADVQKKEQTLVVMITTDKADSVSALQAKAQKFGSADTYPLAAPRTAESAEPPMGHGGFEQPDATSPQVSGATSTQPMPVTITVENVEDGAKLVFAPTNGKLDELEARLETDVERLESGACSSPNTMSLSHVDH